MFQFLHAADIHLDSPLVGLQRAPDAPAEVLRGATRRALENLVRLAIDEEVAFVVLAGDSYDGDWRDYNTGLFFIREMARLREAGIPVFLVKGNHDAASRITKHLRLPDNVRTFSSRNGQTHLLEELGVAVHGRSFPSRAVTENLALTLPEARKGYLNLGLLHTSLDGRPGHDAYAPCHLDDLRTLGYDYWALGHVHAHEVVARDPWVVFPGNVQGRHVRETGPKGCVLVRVDDGVVTDLETRALDVVRWGIVRVDGEGADTPSQVVDRVRDALEALLGDADERTVAARVIVQGTCPAHGALRGAPEKWVEEVRAVAAAIAPDDLWVERVKFDTRAPADLEQILCRDDALGGLLRAIHEAEDGPEALESYGEEFRDLRRKLPSELLAAEDGLDPTAPDHLREALGRARDLLVERLVHGREGGQA